ncbi:MAG: hypothetical protein MI750_14160 [Xanthomonadales bacterium]|nr:hypothetical protein [Xanthomonadales bacterium]
MTKIVTLRVELQCVKAAPSWDWKADHGLILTQLELIELVLDPNETALTISTAQLSCAINDAPALAVTALLLEWRLLKF